jgi:hypothetical protein
MAKIEEGGKEEIIKDSMLKIIKGSEAIALQAVDSTAEVLKEGLANAEDLSAKASDILLNVARRAISAGSTVGDDVRAATKNMVSETIRVASEIGDELKGAVGTTVQGKAPARKSKEEAKSE